MKTVRVIRSVFVSLATIGLCVPSVALAADPAPQPVVSDIALANGGTLQGRLIDLQGGSVAGVPVSLRTQDRVVATTTTEKDGQFAVKGLNGGVYQVAAAQGQGVYRFWTDGTAPPSAKSGAIVYTQNSTGGGGIKSFLSNPLVIAGIVATAIAVPVAIANSQDSSP
jgi:hypothetical protein